MKRILAIVLAVLMLAGGLACAETAAEALAHLIDGNAAYVNAIVNPGDISAAIRADTAENGQHPTP